jgi:hypothetical protein
MEEGFSALLLPDYVIGALISRTDDGGNPSLPSVSSAGLIAGMGDGCRPDARSDRAPSNWVAS